MGYTKIVKSGTLVEIYEYEREPIPPSRRKSNKRFRGKNPVRYRRNLQRARLNFFRLVRANIRRESPPYFLTLTHTEVVGYSDGWKNFSVFIALWRRVRKRMGLAQFNFVAVQELQERGSSHFHCLIWGLSYDEVAREYFNRTIAKLWAHGFIDIRPSDGESAIAGYLTKYMVKSLYDKRIPPQSKLYTASRGLVRPMSTHSKVAIAIIQGELNGGRVTEEGYLEAVDNLIAPVKETVYNTAWLGRCVYKRYEM